MNAEVRRRWLAALRSGEFRQGRGALHQVDGAGVATFCCLGVLCHLAHADGVVTRTDRRGLVRYGDALEAGALPVEVRRWAGLLSPDPLVVDPTAPDEAAECLSAWNDGVIEDDDDDDDSTLVLLRRRSFAEIADIIERSDL